MIHILPCSGETAAWPNALQLRQPSTSPNKGMNHPESKHAGCAIPHHSTTHPLLSNNASHTPCYSLWQTVVGTNQWLTVQPGLLPVHGAGLGVGVFYGGVVVWHKVGLQKTHSEYGTSTVSNIVFDTIKVSTQTFDLCTAVSTFLTYTPAPLHVIVKYRIVYCTTCDFAHFTYSGTVTFGYVMIMTSLRTACNRAVASSVVSITEVELYRGQLTCFYSNKSLPTYVTLHGLQMLA